VVKVEANLKRRPMLQAYQFLILICFVPLQLDSKFIDGYFYSIFFPIYKNARMQIFLHFYKPFNDKIHKEILNDTSDKNILNNTFYKEDSNDIIHKEILMWFSKDIKSNKCSECTRRNLHIFDFSLQLIFSHKLHL
jgi:hypothetical protein